MALVGEEDVVDRYAAPPQILDHLLGFDDAYQGFQITRLHLMDRDGSGVKVLTSDLDRSVAAPTWSSRPPRSTR